MTVHVDSKIALWVNDFHPSFYASLTDKENWAYVENELDVDKLAALQTYFEDLQTAMDDWKAGTNSARTGLAAVISRLVTYQMYVGRGMVEGTVTDEQLDAKQIFDMNGLIAATLSRPTNYYDDITEPTPEATSVKLEADIALLEPSAWKPPEIAKLATIEAAANSVVSAYNYKAQFEDMVPVEDPPVPKNKLETAQWIFLTLHYKWAKDTFPGVTLTIPASVA